MKSIKVDKSGDIVIENNELVFIDGYEEIAQSIYITLSTNKGEWFLNVNYGLDYPTFEGKDIDTRNMILELEESIMQVESIQQAYINDIEINHKDRSLKIHGYATDKDGLELDLSKMEVKI